MKTRDRASVGEGSQCVGGGRDIGNTLNNKDELLKNLTQNALLSPKWQGKASLGVLSCELHIVYLFSNETLKF